MKKLILALIALGFAFAISSCCDQTKGSCKTKCQNKESTEEKKTSARIQERTVPVHSQVSERVHRKW